MGQCLTFLDAESFHLKLPTSGLFEKLAVGAQESVFEEVEFSGSGFRRKLALASHEESSKKF